MARNVVAQLQEFGRTRRGWLGVRIQTVTPEIAEGLGLDVARGALVASVTPEGPAAAAGIEPGDVIVEFDGREVEEMRELPRFVAETEVGREVPVEVWRSGEIETVTVALGELEAAEEQGLLASGEGDGDGGPASARTLDELGLTLAPMSDELRERYGISNDVEGVVITEVAGGSPAEEKELLPGEVILEVGQEPVVTPDDVVDRIADAREAGRRSVLLLVEKDGDLRFVALSIED